MTLVHSDEWLDIHQGDNREVLATPEQSVHAVVTSPPFWGLRDYKLPPSVWGGDPPHGHDFTATEGYTGHRGARGQVPQTKHPNNDYPQTRHQAQGRTSARHGRANVAEQHSDSFRSSQGFCACGAWLGCLGLEPQPEMYVDHIVEVMDAVWRVLRDDGTLWLNLGDTFWSVGGAGGTMSSGGAVRGTKGQVPRVEQTNPELFGRWNRRNEQGIKTKDLVGIPWMTAFALRRAGWYLRRDVIWSKANAMPESTEDRPTSAHEYIFMLAKSGDPKYWTHRDRPGTRKEPSPDWVWREPVIGRAEGDSKFGPLPAIAESPTEVDGWRRVNLWAGHDYFYDWAAVLEPLSYPEANGQPFGGVKAAGGTKLSGRSYPGEAGARYDAAVLGGRRKRSVWNVNTVPYRGAHYAVFPPELIRPMIRASTSERGACGVCGAPLARVTEMVGDIPMTERRKTLAANATDGTRLTQVGGTARSTLGTGSHGDVLPRQPKTTGWARTCEHPDHEPSPAVVLDPFAGSGTTGLVAQQERRKAVLIDLNGNYLRQQMARATREFGVGGTYAREGTETPSHPEDSLWEHPKLGVLDITKGDE